MSSNITLALQIQILHLQSVSRNIAIILGLTLFVVGVIGNLLNIITFYTLGNWKYNPSSFYILVKSFADILCLLVGVLLETVGNGYLLNLTSKNRIWCKLRFPLTCVPFLISLTCICLQSIDVYFCSSQSVAVRRKSNIRVARCLIVGFLFLWIAQTIPNLVFQDLVQIGTVFACRAQNLAYTQYISYFISLGLFVVIPITIISIFGCFTYKNLHMKTTQNRRVLSSISRQMVNISFLQIFSLLLFQLPYGSMLVYSLSTSNVVKDNYRSVQEQVAGTFLYAFAFCTASVSGIFAFEFSVITFLFFSYRSTVIVLHQNDFDDKLFLD